MNKRAIWAIIGLMSAAMVGMILLQLYWINWSLQLNESQFDKNVFDGLNRVADRLEINEPTKFLPLFKDNPSEKLNKRPIAADIVDTEGRIHDHAMTNLLNRGATESGGLTLDSKFYEYYHDTDCNCEDCRYQRKVNLVEYTLVKNLLLPSLLEDRINIEQLGLFLNQELGNFGIAIDYHYGIFSTERNSFVIEDDHFVVEDDSPKVSQKGISNLETSKYKGQLFTNDLEPPGFLYIHFPSKASLVWGNMWKQLLSSILLTAIILFCFLYTIQVIFRQKKIGEMKTDFINNMTHEFKTPIATISLAADSITSPMISNDPSKVKRFANIIKQENKRMNNQVEKVLKIALLDKQDFELNLTSVNLNDVVKQAVSNTSLQVEKKGGTVIAELNAVNPTIQGDATHISNVIHNLLDNANKYTPENPQIKVLTRNSKKGVEIIVSDNGIGINKESRKHIFDKFYRVHTGNLHDVKGFGLGLSYVKAIIDAHKGEIDVMSELGKGSSFIIQLPNKNSTV